MQWRKLVSMLVAAGFQKVEGSKHDKFTRGASRSWFRGTER